MSIAESLVIPESGKHPVIVGPIVESGDEAFVEIVFGLSAHTWGSIRTTSKVQEAEQNRSSFINSLLDEGRWVYEADDDADIRFLMANLWGAGDNTLH